MNDFIQSPHSGQKNKRVPKTRRVFDSNRPYNSAPNFHSNKYQGMRNGNMQRPARQNSQNNTNDQAAALSTATTEAILTLVKTIAVNQELLTDIQKRRIAAEERKANALENIAEYLLSLSIPLEQKKDEIHSDESFQEDEIISDNDVFKTGIETKYGLKQAEFNSQQARKQPEVEVIKETKTLASEKAQIKKDIHKKKISKITKETTQNTPVKNKSILSREDAMDTINRMREQGSTFNQIAQYLIDTGQPTFSGKGKWHAQTIHRLLQKQKQLKAA